MAGTNPNDTTVNDDDREVTEEDLRKLKYPDAGVEQPEKDADEPADGDEDANSDDTEEKGDEDKESDSDDSEDSNEDDDDTFIKEFPKFKGDTVEEYTRNLEQGYKNSSDEAIRLASENTTLKTENETLRAQITSGKPADDSKPNADVNDGKQAPKSPSDLWIQQKIDAEIATAWGDFSKDYTQVDDATEYGKFEKTVQQLATTILHTEGRMAPANELYPKAAAALGWEKQSAPSQKEKLKMALKSGAAISRTGSPSPKKAPKSKVTDAMVQTNMRMYPGKTEKEIREELEEYVQ